MRRGNTEDPGGEWSRWFGPYAQSGSAVIEAPPARYVQWKAVIHDGRPGDGIYWVSIAYLPRNVAPVIDGIALQEPGVRAQSTFIVAAGQQQNVTLKMPPSRQHQRRDHHPKRTISRASNSRHKGSYKRATTRCCGTAHDANDDELQYAIYFRGENEHEWQLLKDKLDQKYLFLGYHRHAGRRLLSENRGQRCAIESAGVALTTERESERFEMDNTPPVIEKLEAAVVKSAKTTPTGSLTVKFAARDAATA